MENGLTLLFTLSNVIPKPVGGGQEAILLWSPLTRQLAVLWYKLKSSLQTESKYCASSSFFRMEWIIKFLQGTIKLMESQNEVNSLRDVHSARIQDVDLEIVYSVAGRNQDLITFNKDH